MEERKKVTIDRQNELKTQLDDAQQEVERAACDTWTFKASELRYATIPNLQKQLFAAAKAEIDKMKEDGAILKRSSTRRTSPTWCRLDGHSRAQDDVARWKSS